MFFCLFFIFLLTLNCVSGRRVLVTSLSVFCMSSVVSWVQTNPSLLQKKNKKKAKLYWRLLRLKCQLSPLSTGPAVWRCLEATTSTLMWRAARMWCTSITCCGRRPSSTLWPSSWASSPLQCWGASRTWWVEWNKPFKWGWCQRFTMFSVFLSDSRCGFGEFVWARGHRCTSDHGASATHHFSAASHCPLPATLHCLWPAGTGALLVWGEGTWLSVIDP